MQKKLSSRAISFLLAFLMVLSFLPITALAAVPPIDVSARIEGYDMTFAPATDVSVTNFDLGNHGVTVNNVPEDTITPMHALVQLLSDMGLDPADFGTDVLNVTSSGAFNTIFEVPAGSDATYQSWMYAVNGELSLTLMASQYELEDGDEITFFCTDWVFGSYAKFDKSEITVDAGESFDLTLTGLNLMSWMFGEPCEFEPIEDAELYITDGTNVVSADTATGILTDEDGEASISFDTAGTYLVSAVRLSEFDDETIDISRPLCVVTVEAESATTPVSFDLTPADAVVSLYDSDGARIYPESDGTFDNLVADATYTYTVSKTGYIAKKDTFTYPVAGPISVTLTAAPASTLTVFDSEWANFRGNSNNMGITSSRTPITTAEAQMLWKYKPTAYANNSIIVGDSIYLNSSTKIFKVNKNSGEYEADGTMAGAPSFNIVPMTYANGMIFANINNGRVQAFNAETLESLWISEQRGGQCLSHITYYDGYIYTGFWSSETANQSYVCIPVTDEDPGNTSETKLVQWKHTVPGGFYWAGGVVRGDTIVIGTDDGTSGATGPSKLYALDRLTGEVVDSVDTIGDLRSAVAYDAKSDRLYFSSKGGYVYSVKQNSDGTFDDTSVKSYQIESGWAITATPVVHNGRLYIGIGKGFGTGKLLVMDAANMTVIYDTGSSIPGYPQGSPLLSTAYEQATGKVYVYTTYNNNPGGLMVLEDSAGQETAVIADLFIPENKNYCLASPIADSKGNIYYYNDTGNTFKISAAPAPVEPEDLLTGIALKYQDTDITLTSSGENAYTATVLHTYSAVDVIPTFADGADVKVNGQALQSGKANVALTANGTTTITVVATKDAQTETITIQVTRENEPEALLTGVALKYESADITLTSSGANAYTATVPYTYSAVDVIPTFASGATVRINGQLPQSGKVNIPLTENAVTAITITATKGAQTESITIRITREADPNPGGSFNMGRVIGYAEVSVMNHTFPGAPFTGVILSESNFAIGENDTMMTAILRALKKNGFTWAGTGGDGSAEDYGINYLSYIKKGNDELGEFSGEAQSGWLGNLNDWFVNESLAQFKVSDGDVINLEYTQNLGVDLGGKWGDPNTKLASMEFNKGTLTPAFDTSTFDYVLTLPAGTSSVKVTPHAANRNYLVKILLNEKVTSNAEGASYYKRTKDIPVKDGDIIYIGVAEPAWPSMNNQGGGSSDYAPSWYSVKIEFEKTTPPNPTIVIPPVISGDTMILTITEELAEELLDNVNKKNIVIEMPKTNNSDVKNYKTIIPASELSKFRGNDITINTPAGNITIPASLVNKLADEGKDLAVTVKTENSGMGLDITLGDKSIQPKDFDEFVTISIPYTISGSPTPDMIVMAKGSGSSRKILGTSYYNQRYVTSKVNETGPYETLYNSKYFVDTVNKWMDKPVLYMAARDIIFGIDATHYEPDRPITRAEFTTLLVRMLESMNIPLSTAGATDFQDVPADSWFYETIAKARAAEIVFGVGDNTFEPDAKLSRQDMFTMIHRALEKFGLTSIFTKGNPINFSDADFIAPYAKEAIDFLSSCGLIAGKDNNMVAPTDDSTRGECAQVLYNILKMY